MRLRGAVGQAMAVAIAAVAAGAAVLVGGCATSSPGPAHVATPTGCQTQSSVASAMTSSYRIVVDLGPLAQMYSPGQVPSSVPANAEIMLGGTMSMVDGADAQHLEVHICDRATGAVLTDANPTITVADSTAGTTVTLPVATMQGVGSGQSDLHYGNNVAAPVGHAFVITVAVRGEQADLHFVRDR